VTFFLGTLKIGNAQPCSADALTAVSVLGATSVTDLQVVHVTQLLMTLATSVTPSVMTLPQPLPAGFNSARVPAFTDPNFDTDVLAAFPAGTTLVTTAQALAELQASLKLLTVTVVNNGLVTSTPAGINCILGAGTCSTVVPTGTSVTLTATGTGFIGWSGDCSGTGTCVVPMTADTTVTATFPAASPPATLTIADAGNGTGTVTCSTDGGATFSACAGQYPNGTALVLQGVSSAGSTFTGWSNGTGSVSCTGAANCSVTLLADSTVTATFALNAVTQFSVTALTATGNGGGGTVVCSANGGATEPCSTYAVGTSISISPTPNNASNFTSWTNGTGSVTGNCSNATGACTFTLTANTSITANFNLPTLTVVLAGTGVGTVTSTNIAGINCGATCTAAYNKGTSVTLGATGGGGFSGWSGGSCSGTGTCVVTVNADSTITATFNAGLPPFAQQAYVKASNTQTYDAFGESVALEGDTLVVGSDSEASKATGVNGNQADNSAPNSGAVYVFTRTNGVWTQQAYIKASNTNAGDEFGHYVVLSGDTLAVNAAEEASCATGINGDQTNNNCPSAGAVYVYTQTNGIWTQQAYIKASNTEAGDLFGWYQFALDGDTLAVGAHGESSCATGINGDQTNNNCPAAGATYVFTRTNGVWTQQAYIKASNTEAEDFFGDTQVLSGDTLAVGAYQEASCATGINGDQTNNNCPAAGAVYVYTQTNGIWTQQAYIKASNTAADDLFEDFLALSGDTLLVAAQGESSCATGINGDQTNNNCPFAGAVYMLTRTAGVWTQQAYIKASNTDAGDNFGQYVVISGNTFAVTAQYEASKATGVNGNQLDNSAPISGAAYVFQHQ
jgi:hypothetical protein